MINMKNIFKRTSFLLTAFLTLSACSIFKISFAAQDVSHKIRNLTNNHNTSYTEDAYEIFSRALTNYSENFDNYIDITALNVSIKTEVDLPNFDPNYVAPDFTDILYDYHFEMVESFSSIELNDFETLREDSIELDKFSTLNETRYINLDPTLKYNHDDLIGGFDPGAGITPPILEPIFPFNPINPENIYETNTASIAALTVLFAGIGETAMAGISAATSAMGVALSSSSIPVIGWVVAVALLVAALIAITVIIVENWNIIKKNLNDIRNWYKTEFVIFENCIDTYFDDVCDNGYKSTVCGAVTIGNKDYDLILKNYATYPSFCAEFAEYEDNYEDVLIFEKISKDTKDPNNLFYMKQVFGTHDARFVYENKIYSLGLSTYTFSEQKTLDMMATGYVAYPSSTILAVGIEHERPFEKTGAIFGFEHYHFNATAIDLEKGTISTERKNLKLDGNYKKLFLAHGMYGYPLSNLIG